MAGTSARKPVVLSVDDEANILKSIKRCLRKVDARVITAGSGEEALALLDGERVDVVISDMRMPGMSGAQLLARIRERQPDCARILLTGYSDVEATVQAVNEGGIARYLSKPWDDDELRQTVEDGLRVARLQDENNRLHEELASRNASLETQVAERTEALESSNALLTQAVDDLAQSYETMVELLANLSSMPNPEPETTARKVDLALAMAEACGLDDEARHTLKHAVRLHRIGWTGLPSRLRDKPREALNAEERAQFEQHPVYARALLMSVPKLAGVAKLLHAQHERYDGEGFPERARTDGVPSSAGILALARDYFDYQRGRIEADTLSAANAAERILQDRGAAYAPELVDVFKAVLPKFERVGTALAEIHIDARALQPGMVLSRDLTTSQGALLLNKGAVLTEPLIETIINLERRSDTTLTVHIRHDMETDT